MPHTTTKNRRTKRMDTRPNGKIRTKSQRQANDQLKIQDIRVTRKLKGERKERTINREENSFATLSKDEKLLRALKKKLRGINDLIEKKNQGVLLNPQQMEKITQLDTVLLDMESLIQRNSNTKSASGTHDSSDDDNDDEEEEEDEEEVPVLTAVEDE